MGEIWFESDLDEDEHEYYFVPCIAYIGGVI